MLYLGFGLIFLSTCIFYKLSRTFFTPSVIAGVVWAIVFLLLFNTSMYVSYNHFLYGFIALCVIAFQFASYCAGGKGVISKEIKQINLKVENVKLILLLLFVILVIHLVHELTYAINNKATLLEIVFVLKLGQITGDWNLLFFVPYVYTFSCIFSASLLYFLCNSSSKVKKKMLLKLYIVSLCISLSFAISLLGRVYILQLATSNIFIFIFSAKLNRKKLIKILFILALCLVCIFTIYGISKYFYRLGTMSLAGFFDSMLSVYVGGPLVGLQLLIDNGFACEGKFSLEFFYKVFSIFGVKIEDPSVGFTVLGPREDLNGNVYTLFFNYIFDFGYLATVIIMILLGVIHGLLYKKAKINNNAFSTCILAISYYPLLMQFFAEQYFTQISFFIQVMLFCFIIFKTNMLVKKEQFGAGVKKYV